MACFHPLEAWQLTSGEIVFSERGSVKRSLQLSCGQCIGCRLEKSRQWAVRCLHESSLYNQNSFITLTYDDEHLPVDGSLDYRHFQLFMKRLRRTMGPARFYMCGEYGENTWRPHYHALLFGVGFSDRILFSSGTSGDSLYTSETLSNIWAKGHAIIGDVTFKSAGYVARYAMKKVNGTAAQEHYLRADLRSGEIFSLAPELSHMSLKPGIGADWFKKFSNDVYNKHDFVVVNGVACKPPGYYDTLLKKLDPDNKERVDYDRFKKSLLTITDSTPERLAVREEVLKAHYKRASRTLE